MNSTLITAVLVYVTDDLIPEPRLFFFITLILACPKKKITKQNPLSTVKSNGCVSEHCSDLF